MNPNLKAFLDMIAFSEIGPGAAREVGQRLQRAGRLDARQAAALRQLLCDAPARSTTTAMNSDAAGRYQFMGRYWSHYKLQLSCPTSAPNRRTAGRCS
jgi:muramidase (phage lysozyme)